MSGNEDQKKPIILHVLEEKPSDINSERAQPCNAGPAELLSGFNCGINIIDRDMIGYVLSRDTEATAVTCVRGQEVWSSGGVHVCTQLRATREQRVQAASYLHRIIAAVTVCTASKAKFNI